MRKIIAAPKIRDKGVKAVFAAWPEDLREDVEKLRAHIFSVANETKGVGRIEETLKWKVPAYLTLEPKSGTTIRLHADASANTYGLFVHCQTSLIETCRELYPDIFVFEKNRGLLLRRGDKVPTKELRHFIAMALTYHLKFVPSNVQMLPEAEIAPERALLTK